MKIKGIGIRIDLHVDDNFNPRLDVLSSCVVSRVTCNKGFSIRIRIFISVAASWRNIGSVRNPLLLKGVTDAFGNRAIKIIKRAHL